MLARLIGEMKQRFVRRLARRGAELREDELARTRLQLLSKMSTLAGALEYDEVLASIARLSLPELADWCIVDVVEDGTVRRAKVAHRDPAMARLADELLRFPPVPRYRGPEGQGLLSGRPLLVPDFGHDMLRGYGFGREHDEIVCRLGARSVMVVPLVVQSTTVAVTTWVRTASSGRRYGPDDLALAEELARRAAQVVENARLHQRLRQSEARFRVALAHSNIAVYEQDSELRYRWIYNPQFGYQPADVLGRTNDDFFPPDEAARLSALEREVLRTGERVREEALATVGGEPRHLLFDFEPLRDASDAIVGITGAATDITAAKKAQQELAQALAFREQVMGILGHDLRNPLSAVRVLATLLSRRDDLPEEVRSSVSEIDRAARRMVEMIGTLLDFTESRTSGILPITPAPTDIHAVCRSVVEEMLAANPGRSIELNAEGDGRGRWDPARMAQVVSNLLANAFKYGTEQEPVRVWIDAGETEVVLRVENDGPAIPPELLPVLFEPFRRGSAPDHASASRGLGLGLYIVRQIVSAHGGAISVESTAERGTSFIVRLPRSEGRPDRTEGERLSWDGSAPAGA